LDWPLGRAPAGGRGREGTQPGFAIRSRTKGGKNKNKKPRVLL